MNIIIILIILCLAFKLIFAFKFYRKLALYKEPDFSVAFEKPVSVIIAAKNEAKNLKENLPIIFNQNFRTFEVVVVDDYSEDETLNVLKQLQKKHENLTIVEKNNFKNISGKKSALTAAIKNSKYEYLLFTDADCKANSKDWITFITKHFTNPTIEIVLGYGPYQKTNNGFLNKFIRYETVITAMKYFGFALNKTAFMGVGRNLAYKKSLFEKVNGFENHKNIASGDDDLSICKMANRNNVAIELSEKSWCFSNPKETLKSYIQQKNRHVSTAKYYNWNVKIWLALFSLMHFLLYVFWILLLFTQQYFAFVATFIIYVLILFLENKTIFKKLKEQDLIKNSLFLDAYFMFYYLFAFGGLFDKKQNGKW